MKREEEEEDEEEVGGCILQYNDMLTACFLDCP